MKGLKPKLSKPSLQLSGNVVIEPAQLVGVEQVIAAHRAIREPITVVHLGYRFTILPGVFSPFVAPSGFLMLSFASWPIFKNRRVLEVGCGSGVMSCLIALSGAKVVGIDINPEAIKNADLNKSWLNLESQVEFRIGDLFQPVRENEQFDIIFADLPFTSGEPKDMLERAFFDPKLQSIRRYISGAKELLVAKRCSQVFVALSDLDGQEVPRFAEQLNFRWLSRLRIDLDWIRLNLAELCLP